MRKTVGPILLATLLATLAACGGSRTTGADEHSDDPPAGQLKQTLDVTNTLSQSVTVSPPNPGQGSNITIRSVLTNRGSAAVDVESRFCGLNYAGTLTLTGPPEVMKCAGYSMQSTLAAGDSVVTQDLMRVTSGPGNYTLRVQHALSPSAWAEVAVQVRSR